MHSPPLNGQAQTRTTSICIQITQIIPLDLTTSQSVPSLNPAHTPYCLEALPSESPSGGDLDCRQRHTQSTPHLLRRERLLITFAVYTSLRRNFSSLIDSPFIDCVNGGERGIGAFGIASRSSYGCPISSRIRSFRRNFSSLIDSPFIDCVNGGERGIRTLGGVTPTHPFQGCTIGHSVISPLPDG